ncbi:hypothetical protein EBB07_04775 [Paenibacillaceae bacterium]|nr:hypothetical protein EBB07_04775 [Paenibacillaceae bacterium]
MNRVFDKQVAPVIDIFPDLCGVPYHRQTVRNKLTLLKKLGFTRVYLVDAPPNYPQFSNPWLDLLDPSNKAGNYAVESILAMGDPVFEHIYEAHRLGMEAIVIMKPYEGGGGYTLPHGKGSTLRNRTLPCIGGERTGFDSFLTEHGNLRVGRKPIPDYERLMRQPITRMVMTFPLNEVIERTSPSGYITHPSQPDEVVGQYPMKQLHLWTSNDNGTYKRYDGNFTIEERIVLTTLTDANGHPLYDAPQRCREVTVDGLNIGPEFLYMAVTMDLEHKLIIPFSMIRLFSSDEELPVTVSPYARGRSSSISEAESSSHPDPNSNLDSNSDGHDSFIASMPLHCGHSEDALAAFKQSGFEFEWYGSGMWDAGWMSSPCYGIARGKMKYLKGTLCEAYPEVREYWLDRVDKLLAMGADGIDLRLQNHSSMISDYANYGYNLPIVEAYEQEYGVNILKEEADPLKLMRIRGNFYMRFVEEAARLIHSHHKKLHLHVRESLIQPKLSSAFGELGFWAMPKILPDWERLVELADEVTMKDYNWGDYSAARSSILKDRVSALGKPLWIHCYLAQGNDLNERFITELSKDARITGLLLYETGHNPYVNNSWQGIIEAKTGGEAVYHHEMVDKMQQLGLTKEGIHS